ncbi:MAG: Na+/H+ antiporter NhaC family protein, partial [Oscillospiraceae bacterium]
LFRVGLTTSYLFAALTLIGLMVFNKIKTFKNAFSIYTSGMQKMTNVTITLILAWSFGSTIKELGTANYIIEFMQGNVPSFLIPTIIFLIGACVSFTTGSSWGAFAIMMPLAIPMAVSLNSPIYICIGAVLSGGLFGDHCSPISDTTILSSTGAGCDLIDHVKTQLPYALLNGLISIIGFLIAGLTGNNFSVIISLILLPISCFLITKFKRNEIQ